MSYQVYWTPQTKKTANKIVEYLRKEWAEKEVDDFLNRIDVVVSMIEINPKLFVSSVKKPNIHLTVIKRKTILVYQIRPLKKQIALLLFWNPKQDPEKFKY